jgi:hypothetical protein
LGQVSALCSAIDWLPVGFDPGSPVRLSFVLEAFDDPIDLPDGRQFVTLEDVGAYITASEADQQLDEWQTAMECLMLVVKLGGPTMFARKPSIVTPNACSFARPDSFGHQVEHSVELLQKPTRNRGFFQSDSNMKDGAGIGAGISSKQGAIYDQETSEASHPTGGDAKHRANR